MVGFGTHERSGNLQDCHCPNITIPDTTESKQRRRRGTVSWKEATAQDASVLQPASEDAEIKELRAPSFSQGYGISHNHRMFGVGRDLCGSSSPTPLPKQGHPEQAAQDPRTSRQVLNISREGDSTAPLGNRFQCSVTLRSCQGTQL